MRHRPRAVMLVLAVATATAGTAHAADTRFERVVVLPAPDRVSVVFELTGEPADVSTRRVSAAVFELDAGPIAMPLTAGTYLSPPGVRFVASVAVQGATVGERGMLKARITLLERSRSAVRVIGRRVYVDFMAGEPPRVLPPEPVESSRPARTERRTPPEPERPPAATPAPTPAAAYQAAVEPLIARFEELRPFLISASSAPSPPVLAALTTTLSDISQSVHRLDAPVEARHVHGLLSSAITLAMTAVDPAFGGDRSAQAQQALALLTQARRSL